MDMTHGSLWKKILRFSLPLIASNILQLLFNAADVVVVGRFSGYDSLAAVGSTSMTVYLFTNLFIGLAVGVNVVIARYLGQGGREKEISLVLHTAVLVALVGGAALGAAAILASDWILTWVSTPADIYSLALLYLQIYFVGTPFVLLYNYGAAALRARGDTRRPLLYLTVSGALNVVLNLFFVVVLDMDVAGVALATVLSQALSAGMVLWCLMKAKDAFRVSWKNLRIHWGSLYKIARLGIPAGAQACLFSLSNVTIQGAINSYGSVVIAGYSAGFNIENFIYASMNAFNQTSQTFVSQNVGAGRHDRVGRILRLCLASTVILGMAEIIVVLLFPSQLVSIFNTDPAVIEQGVLRLHIVATLYFLYGMVDVLTGAIRGYGVSIAPVIINLLGTCAFRIVWIQLLDTTRYGVEYVYLSYPASWIVVLIALSILWVILRKRKKAQGVSMCLGGKCK